MENNPSSLEYLGFLSPRPRYGHRVVAVRGLILLFGGGDNGIIDDLLVYSTENGNWFQPSTNGQVSHNVRDWSHCAKVTSSRPGTLPREVIW